MKQIIRHRGEGELRWFYGGGVHEWKVRSEESNGSLFVLEDTLVRGKTTPIHTHPHDELVYVIEGEVVCFGDGTERRASAGAVVFNPRGTPHAFTVVSETARVLAIQTPGAGEAFYLHASEPAEMRDGVAVEGKVDFRRIQEAAIATGGTNVLGPPPKPKGA
jgi:quercetin dioxygenase-like cupin family protein